MLAAVHHQIKFRIRSEREKDEEMGFVLSTGRSSFTSLQYTYQCTGFPCLFSKFSKSATVSHTVPLMLMSGFTAADVSLLDVLA